MEMDRAVPKVAVVTGAAQGIGKAIAQRLAHDGFAVALVDINSSLLAEVAAEIEASGARALALTADLASVEAVQEVIGRAAAWGTLTVLVNNAGRARTTPFLEVTEQDWDEIMSVDLKAVFFATQFAARHMPGAGRVVNLSSISGRRGRADQAPYAAAKCAIISLTQSAALSFASRGITVNAVCPGEVDTPMKAAIYEARARVQGVSPEEVRAQAVAKIPIGRIETAEDVAGVVSFLCSPDAAYVTGQALNVCGGMEMH